MRREALNASDEQVSARRLNFRLAADETTLTDAALSDACLGAVVFAAQHPKRVDALVLMAPWQRPSSDAPAVHRAWWRTHAAHDEVRATRCSVRSSGTRAMVGIDGA